MLSFEAASCVSEHLFFEAARTDAHDEVPTPDWMVVLNDKRSACSGNMAAEANGETQAERQADESKNATQMKKT